MRIQRSVLPFALLLLPFLSSCLTYYPNLIKTPLMRHKGEGHAAGYVVKNGFDAYASYAVTDNIAVMGSGTLGFNSDAEGTDTHMFGEGAIGVFGQVTEKLTGEAYVGAGFGQSTSLQANDSSSRQLGNYFRGFVMGDVSCPVGPADVGVTARLSAVDFLSGREVIDQKPFGLFIEPAVFGRIGWQHFKVDGQVGMSWHILSDPGFGTDKLFYGIGLHWILPEMF